jgi:putative nucleotidyltransferase with HDIG domain
MRIPGGTRSWPARALLYPARHIRWRIIAPYAVLTIILAVAGTYLVTQLVTDSFEERFNNQLAEASRVASDSLARRERKHLETVRSVAFTQGVATAAGSSDRAALAQLVGPIAANDKADSVEILDANGRRVYGTRLVDADKLTYTDATDTDNRATWPLVRKVLDHQRDAQGDKFSDIASTDSGYGLFTAGPIFDGEHFAGVVLVGTPLTSLLPQAKADSLADVSVYDFAGAPLGSTFGLGDKDANVQPDASVVSASGVAAPVREHKTLFGRDFDMLYGNLVVRGQTVGVYSVALPSSFLVNAGAATRLQIGLLFTVATVAVLLSGWFIGRSITDPVFKLVQATRRVAAGDLSTRSGVGGDDEIGTLGVAFDKMTERLQRQNLATIRALTSAIDARDPYTMGHSLRVGQLAMEIGREIGLDEKTLQHLEIGGYLHDIGKIGVRDAVLLKPGALDPEERAAIEQHPSIGLDILAHVELPPEVIEFVGSHHEKLNGSGYPAHLHAEHISVVPRIAAVADIYDALTTDRPYRPGMGIPKALSILGEEADQGKLDHSVVGALERVIPRWQSRLKAEPDLKGFSIGDSPPQQERAA